MAELPQPALGVRARDVRAAHPLHLRAFGEEVVPVEYADVTSSNVTRGHRVLGPGEHVVKDPACYVDVCREAGVLFEDARRKVIRDGIVEVEAERGGAHVDTPKRIFDEVVNLTEYPTVLVGKFDEEFLDVPNEIICDSMLSNQRYFPVYDAKGALTREFVVVPQQRAATTSASSTATSASCVPAWTMRRSECHY